MSELRAAIAKGMTQKALASFYGVGKTTIHRWVRSDFRENPMNMPGRPDHHRYAILPCLAEKMRIAGATNESLARAAGYSLVPIIRARAGKRIRMKVAVDLMQTLNTVKFKRDPRGPHEWSPSRRAAYERRHHGCRA